jgi:hypothetical protein
MKHQKENPDSWVKTENKNAFINKFEGIEKKEIQFFKKTNKISRKAQKKIEDL